MAAEVLIVNPSARPSKRGKHRARNAKGHFIKARSNPSSHRGKSKIKRKRRHAAKSRRVRRNPSGGMMTRTVMPVAIGAGGALLADLALGFVPLPDMLKTDTMKPIVKLGAAVGIGMIARKVAGRDTGNKVMAGALTVVAYGVARDFLQKHVPSLPLGDMHAYPVLEYANPGVGELMWADGGVGDLVDDSAMGALVDTSEMGEVVY